MSLVVRYIASCLYIADCVYSIRFTAHTNNCFCLITSILTPVRHPADLLNTLSKSSWTGLDTFWKGPFSSPEEHI